MSGLSLSACAGSSEPTDDAPYDSVRERLEHEEARLIVAHEGSAGSIRAELLAGDGGWEGGLVELRVESGEVALRAAGGAVLIERLAFGIAPIVIPASLIGIDAQLVDVRAELIEPVLAPATWDEEDREAHVQARVKLELSRALAVDESAITLGAPSLPPLPLDLTLTGDGKVAHAEVRIRAAGEIWMWAGLVRLVDLFVVASADG